MLKESSSAFSRMESAAGRLATSLENSGDCVCTVNGSTPSLSSIQFLQAAPFHPAA
jgi:hypothetical protein